MVEFNKKERNLPYLVNPALPPATGAGSSGVAGAESSET